MLRAAMTHKYIFPLIFLTCLCTVNANADVLCAKKSQSVSKNKFSFSSAIKVASDSCPSGYSEVLNTSSFKGDTGATGATGSKGDTGNIGLTGAQGLQGIQGPAGATGPQGAPGTPALSNSTCRKAQQQFVNVFTNSNRTYSGVSLSCNAGEYAHAIRIYVTTEFSSDYSLDSSTSNAGTIVEGFEGVPSPNNEIFDSQELFTIGYEEPSEDHFDPSSIVTGSETFTKDITIICCLLGE